MWDPDVYRRFGAERSRPFDDLVGRIGARTPRAVVDLGCGSGELTAGLGRRWPGSRIVGVDSSAEMIRAARARPGRCAYEVGDLRDFVPAPDVDVLISNAALQWVPEHRELLLRWIAGLPPGGWLAMQVPGNFDAPSHRALREVAGRAPYAPRLAGVVRADPVDDPSGYAAMLSAAGAAVDAWETTYVHLLPDDDGDPPVLRWMEGTALRPIRAALDDAAWSSFRAHLAAELAVAYPPRDGLVAFPFRRVFVVARTPSAPNRTTDKEPS
ncbi:trans-aconitate 2-methyltransferase [Mangrovihabitans endophyticus]|uniref:Trans-aconitate 2-methyltransferase n=1 Tax=Mangrovihabitans endophyticus TaxID=1751298 RepID=A0A8J3BWZ0_9ACTN|nr:trans-aconitate 2-methyltransferase [Mangrovihabitans endophyticus]GGK85496.1 trans-aconitate 2-methyltransferase [Mangrovihabitans endophyticus]